MSLPPVIPPVSITPFLSCSEVITCTNAKIRSKARSLTESDTDDLGRVRSLYYWVRDNIRHSVDNDKNEIKWGALDVISAGHGLCMGKSHLFVALCRSLGIPAGLCYQRVKTSGDTYVIHGLAAVYLEQLQRWIRLDPRGNKHGVFADFSVNEDIIAYKLQYEGEWLDQHIYPEPWHDLTRMADISASNDEFIRMTSGIETPPVHHERILEDKAPAICT